jgi:hypothetical protein
MPNIQAMFTEGMSMSNAYVQRWYVPPPPLIIIITMLTLLHTQHSSGVARTMQVHPNARGDPDGSIPLSERLESVRHP